MFRRTLVAAVAVATLAAVAAACSGGSGHSSSTPTSTVVPARDSAGCTAVATIAPGDSKVTITSGGRDRWYLRHVPPSYRDTTAMPVVVDLHGYAEGAEIHTRMSGLGAFGDREGFITVDPQGEGKVPRWDTSLAGDDVAFVGAVLDDVERTLCVDRNRIHVTGLSMGAFMTSAVACRYADRVASVAPVAGIRDIAGCKPSRPVPVVAFHGTDDGYVAWDGGYGAKVADLPSPDGSGQKLGQTATRALGPESPSIPTIAARWAKRNGCGTTPARRRVAKDVVDLRFPCPAHQEVELYRIDGGGHAWPGSAFSASVPQFVGRTTMSISADEVMWRFFRLHPLRPKAG